MMPEYAPKSGKKEGARRNHEIELGRCVAALLENRRFSTLTPFAALLHGKLPFPDPFPRVALLQKRMKKKVFIAITKSNWGGAQRYVFDLARSLPSEQYNVTVLCGGEGVLARKLRSAGTRVIGMPHMGRDVRAISDLTAFFALVRILWRERPDILHLNSSKMGILGALAGRLTLVPRIIFTAHGWAFNESRSPLSRFVIRLLALLTVFLSHKTIAVSDAVRSDMRTFGRSIITIQNGIDAMNFLEHSEARASFSDVPPHAFWVGTIAELHHVKGLVYAVHAFQKFLHANPHAHFVIIGEGDERKNIEKEIQRLGLAETVHMVGFKEEAEQYLKAFDIFLISSLSEGLSYVLIGAGAAELPVVATRVGGIPEVIDHGENGLLVPPGNSDATAAALQKLSLDPELRKSYATALFRKVHERFSLSDMLRHTIAVYENA